MDCHVLFVIYVGLLGLQKGWWDSQSGHGALCTRASLSSSSSPFPVLYAAFLFLTSMRVEKRRRDVTIHSASFSRLIIAYRCKTMHKTRTVLPFTWALVGKQEDKDKSHECASSTSGFFPWTYEGEAEEAQTVYTSSIEAQSSQTHTAPCRNCRSLLLFFWVWSTMESSLLRGVMAGSSSEELVMRSWSFQPTCCRKNPSHSCLCALRKPFVWFGICPSWCCCLGGFGGSSTYDISRSIMRCINSNLIPTQSLLSSAA